MFYVKGTYREDACDESSAISGLVLDEPYEGFTVHNVEKLKPLADSGQLKVYSSGCGQHVGVIIYYSTYYRRYIATTVRDGLECNNLLSLQIFYPSSKQSTETTYSQCSL